MTKGSEDYNKRGIVQSTRARFVGTKSSWSVKKESYVKISKDCESLCGDGEATKLIASSRFTDKGARRKRGKASAIPRTFPCKESFSPMRGGKRGEKNMENRKRFPGFGQVCGKGLNERNTGRLRCSSIIPPNKIRYVASRRRCLDISQEIIIFLNNIIYK